MLCSCFPITSVFWSCILRCLTLISWRRIRLPIGASVVLGGERVGIDRQVLRWCWVGGSDSQPRARSKRKVLWVQVWGFKPLCFEGLGMKGSFGERGIMKNLGLPAEFIILLSAHTEE